MSSFIDELAAVSLTAGSREMLEQVRTELETFGAEQCAAKYYGREDELGYSLWEALDNHPTPVWLLVTIGTGTGTVGWVEWSGEDDEFQVCDQVIESCRRLGLNPPSIPRNLGVSVLSDLEQAEGPQRGEYVPALLGRVDTLLSAAGLRLLMIDPDADTYYFVPVTAEAFAGLVGRTEGTARLRAAADIAP